MVAARTGLVLDSYFSAPKMAWLRRKRPDRRRGHHVGHLAAAPTHRSFRHRRHHRQPLTDRGTGSRGLGPAVVVTVPGSRTRNCPASSATTRPSAPQRHSGRDTLGGVVVDQQAALLAEACLQPGMAKCTLGTGAFLLANTGSAAVHFRRRADVLGRVAHRRPGHLLRRWAGLHRRLGGAVAVLAGRHRRTRGDGQRRRRRRRGVLCVPALAGLAAPWWKPMRRHRCRG